MWVSEWPILDFGQEWKMGLKIHYGIPSWITTKCMSRKDENQLSLKIICVLFSFRLNEGKSHEKCSIFQATKFLKDCHSFSFSVLFRYLCKRTNIITKCRNAPRSISPVFANILSSDYAVCTASLMFAF